jgi:hypothetical protein
MASIHSQRSAFKLSLTTLSVLVGVIIISMTTVILLILNAPNFNAGRLLHDFYLDQSFPSDHMAPDLERSTNSSTVMIKTFNTGSYTFGTAELPSEIILGKVVTFVLDVEDSSHSVNSLEITITSNNAQYLMFLPYGSDRYDDGKAEFHYVFPEAGTYNVDIAFGAAEGINFNIVVSPEEP